MAPPGAAGGTLPLLNAGAGCAPNGENGEAGCCVPIGLGESSGRVRKDSVAPS